MYNRIGYGSAQNAQKKGSTDARITQTVTGEGRELAGDVWQRQRGGMRQS